MFQSPFDQPSYKAKTKARAKAKPKARAKAKPKPKARAKARAKAKPKARAKARAKAKPKPKARAKARAKAKPKARAKARAKAKQVKPLQGTASRKPTVHKKRPGRTVETIKVGQRGRGQRGVWVPPKVVTGAGFKYGDKIDVHYDDTANRVVITSRPGGIRAVSRHRGKPIVDLTEKALTKAMAGIDEVVVDFEIGQIVLTPAETKRRISERLRDKSGLVGSAFTGGGFMDLAAEMAGYVPRYGIEIEDKYAEIFERNRRGQGYPLTVIKRPIEEALSYNLHLLQSGRPELIPKVELLLMGIPCDPWSRQRGDRATVPSRAHPLYDMTQYALGLIAVSNPLNVLIEEVPGYVKDPQFGILKAVLQRAGYHVTSKVVDSPKIGYAAKRERAYIVATTQRGFSWDTALKKARAPKGMRRVKDILLPPSHPAITTALKSQGNWFSTKDRDGIGKFMREQWKRPHHRPGFVDPSAASFPTIVKGYFSWQATGPFVRHPSKPSTFRMLTVEEIRRAHGVPQGYLLPGAVGTQAEALGQAVVVPLVQGIIEAFPGGAPSRTVDADYLRTRNPPPVVPLYYGHGPLYSTLPWGIA